MVSPVISRRTRIAWAAFAAIVVIAQVAVATTLIRRLPYHFPNGGPDESMHISLTTFIAEHLRWPSWDTEELERYDDGTSYATSSSFGYWIEGLLQRASGRARLSGFLLLAAYLVAAILCLRKSTAAGLFALAAITPQFLFVCSYVNSDAWTALVALALGLAIAGFRRDPGKSINVLLLFAAAGACVSCRFHVWPVGLLAFLYALLPQLPFLIRERQKALLSGLALGVAVASWWPVTSYFANDGDVVGLAAQDKTSEKFGNPTAPVLWRPLSEIDLTEYAILAAKSFYGVWGWANFELGIGYYLFALLLGLPLLAWFWWRVPALVPLHIGMLALNFALMLVYSTTYDYQWQGRYLFPWYFISVGLTLGFLASAAGSPAGEARRRVVLLALAGLAVFNVVVEVQLWRRIERAESADPTERGYLMLQKGHLDTAARDFNRALEQDGNNAPALNGLGLVEWRRRDLEQAEENFRQAIALSPDDPQSHVNLADLLVERGQFAEAISNYETVARKDPGSVYVQLQLVAVHEKLGNLEMARDHCRRALELSPHDGKIRRRYEALERELAKRNAR